MLCPQNMSVGPRLPESMVWHVLKREKRNMLLLLRMMMDYDEGCWMMVMVMVMIVDIVFSSISWGRELRRSPWRALAGIFIEHIHPSRSSSIRNPTLCRTRLRPPSVRTPKGRIPKLKAGGVFPVDTIAATLCRRTSSREKIWGIACVLTLETLQPLADCTTRFSALGNSHSRR